MLRSLRLLPIHRSVRLAMSTTNPTARLNAISRTFVSSSPSPTSTASSLHPQRGLLGHLLSPEGDIRLPVHHVTDQHGQDRLPREDLLLDVDDEAVAKELRWLMQKWELRQDVFLMSSPGPYTRRLALTFLSLLNTPYEIVSLHRDVSENELKQSRELREGGRLEYVDSGAVRAAKNGSVLILDGIERCERGVLPLLNNLLENREMQLEDGTHIVFSKRYDLMVANGEDTTGFIPAHPDFRVIALGCPTPPYPGLPIDPPFRSRFSGRYLDPVEAAKVMARQEISKLRETKAAEEVNAVEAVVAKVAEVMSTIAVSKEMRLKMASGVTATPGEDLPLFPQTSLVKLARFLAVFPPPSDVNSVAPTHLLSLLLALHPSLAYLPTATRRSLEEVLKSAKFGLWSEGISEVDFAAESSKTDEGIFGWKLADVQPSSTTGQALVTFSRVGSRVVVVPVAAGTLPLATFSHDEPFSPRFKHLLTSLFQLHALSSFDISFSPSTTTHSSSSSTSLVISTFSALLGYDLYSVHLYKELGGRELVMRRTVNANGATGFEDSPLVVGARRGGLVHLEGIDTIGATAGSLARLFVDREMERADGRRLTVDGSAGAAGAQSGGILDFISPSFRVITTSTQTTPPSTWLTEDLSSNLVALSTVPMDEQEERNLLLSTGCSNIDVLERFAVKYRAITAVPGSKTQRLGTAALIRISKRLALFPTENVRTLLERALLVEFLPNTEKEAVAAVFKELGMAEEKPSDYPPATVTDSFLRFDDRNLPLYNSSHDPSGSSRIPHIEHYHENSQQTRLQRDIGTDLALLGSHVLLLGAQGTGKNLVIDRLLELLRRPREYAQLHRDSTTSSLLFQTSLEGGQIIHAPSPLLKAITLGRILVLDEVDKAPPQVVAALSSLASRGEMTLPDGRQIRPVSRSGDAKMEIVVHPDFRLILLANRPGFPFLGNAFVGAVGDSFSTYAVVNPDPASELRILAQLAPDLPQELLQKLVAAFQDLRAEFTAGRLSYPFSLRELLALTRHIRRFPDEPLEQALRSIFDFDLNSPTTLDALRDVLRKHKLGVTKIGIDAVRGVASTGEDKDVKIIDFEPTGSTDLTEPKEGQHDDKEHSGGNTWAGGTGGRDTAGAGGRGGYKRLHKGGNIKQVSDALKANVPDEINDRAREMARRELAAKLAALDMSSGEATSYSRYHDAIASQVQQLVVFLENLEAKDEERIWLKRQGDGELDETRLTEGLTGERSIYRRRSHEKPEPGQPQLKPKRIRFIFDVSASMYRNQHDGRLARSLEAALMLLEAFDRLSEVGKQKFVVDVVGHSGEDAHIPLVEAGKWPSNPADRFKLLEKMSLTTQYCWPGDNTIAALEQSIDDVAELDADDRIVIAITDANFQRYEIKPEDVRRAINRSPKVHACLLAVGDDSDAEWLPGALPGKAYRVRETKDLLRTMQAVLSQHLS